MADYQKQPDPRKQFAESVRQTQRQKNEKLFLALWEKFGDCAVPVREFRWHPERKWRADFYFAPRLLVELEGWGRHQTYKGYANDCDKYNEAAHHGFAVLRFTNLHLREEPEQVAWLVRELRKRLAA